eukprot:1150442-Pelagomonas_calceolata.AAC.3
MTSPVMRRPSCSWRLDASGKCVLLLRCTRVQAVKEGRSVNMENYFSRLALDIIGKAVFNYDFDSLTHDDPVIEVGASVQACYHSNARLLVCSKKPFFELRVSLLCKLSPTFSSALP